MPTQSDLAVSPGVRLLRASASALAVHPQHHAASFAAHVTPRTYLSVMDPRIRPEDSLVYLEVRRLESLAARDPARYTLWLAWRYNVLGHEYRESGIDTEYLACHERAAELLQGRASLGEATLADRWDLAQHRFNVVSVALRIGDVDRARSALVELDELVATLNPGECPLRMGFNSFVADVALLRERLALAAHPGPN